MIIKKFDLVIDKIIQWALVSTILTVMILSVLTIVLRWFSLNLQWIEPFVRHLVFLSAFLGGAVATKRGTHIGIDVLGKILEAKGLHSFSLLIQRYIYLLCAFTLIWLGKASYDFMMVEKEFGGEAFFGLHSSHLVGIIPVGFLLVAYRFVYMFMVSFEKKN